VAQRQVRRDGRGAGTKPPDQKGIQIPRFSLRQERGQTFVYVEVTENGLAKAGAAIRVFAGTEDAPKRQLLLGGEDLSLETNEDGVAEAVINLSGIPAEFTHAVALCSGRSSQLAALPPDRHSNEPVQTRLRITPESGSMPCPDYEAVLDITTLDSEMKPASSRVEISSTSSNTQYRDLRTQAVFATGKVCLFETNSQGNILLGVNISPEDSVTLIVRHLSANETRRLTLRYKW